MLRFTAIWTNYVCLNLYPLSQLLWFSYSLLYWWIANPLLNPALVNYHKPSPKILMGFQALGLETFLVLAPVGKSTVTVRKPPRTVPLMAHQIQRVTIAMVPELLPTVPLAVLMVLLLILNLAGYLRTTQAILYSKYTLVTLVNNGEKVQQALNKPLRLAT